MVSSKKGDNVTGAIFPILPIHVTNLFSKERDIFIKYTKYKLHKGFVIIFYVSKEKKIVGEGIITKIETLSPYLAWEKYEKRIFLDQKDYLSYTTSSPIDKTKRKMKELTVFTLVNLINYEKSISSIYPVPPSGRYLTNEMMNNIRDLSS